MAKANKKLKLCLVCSDFHTFIQSELSSHLIAHPVCVTEDKYYVCQRCKNCRGNSYSCFMRHLNFSSGNKKKYHSFYHQQKELGCINIPSQDLFSQPNLIYHYDSDVDINLGVDIKHVHKHQHTPGIINIFLDANITYLINFKEITTTSKWKNTYRISHQLNQEELITHHQKHTSTLTYLYIE